MRKPLLIACDFDGTVTTQDTLVEILNAFGDPHWRRIQDRVFSGEITIRQGLELEMRSVRATPEELRRFLVSRITLDASFRPFLSAMRAKGIPVILLTGGFDFCVEQVLAKEGLTHLPYLANRIRRDDGLWSVEFPYASVSCTACGYCKRDPIELWNALGYTTVFVGNGVTDRCPAQVASLTFAKDELGRWLLSQRIPFAPFSTFEEVSGELKNRGWI